MTKDWVLTPEAFEALLRWLNVDREEAGKKYEEIRLRLIKIFACRGCCEPEDLADESINRVAKRLEHIKDSYTGDPTLYFYGVANKVHMEYLRKKPAPASNVASPTSDNDDDEKEYACLEKCMGNLTPDNRELVLEYYKEERRAKIDHRKQLAAQFGIALNALRIRAHRIRTVLQQCVSHCLQET
jgi:DNA-directed RNA polymerase specialized sigma24 family protein